MQDIGRQKAQDSVAGAVDDDAPLEHFGDNQLGQVGGVDFGGNHQATSAHVNDSAMALSKSA